MYHTEFQEFKARFEPLLVIALSVFGAFYSSYLYIKDLKLETTGSGPKIASLLEATEGIKKRNRSSFLWSPVSEGATLFLRDSISVGPNGHAIIELNDDTKIELGSDSLIQLNDTKDFAVNFIRGTFILRTKTEDTRVEIKRTGEKKVEPLRIRLESPKPESVFLVKPNSPFSICFQWISKGKEVSQKNAFLELANALNSTEKQMIPIENLSKNETIQLFKNPGQYFWKITDGKVALTEPRSFKVRVLEEPKTEPVKPIVLPESKREPAVIEPPKPVVVSPPVKKAIPKKAPLRAPKDLSVEVE